MHTHEINAAGHWVGVCHCLGLLFFDNPPDQIGCSCRPGFDFAFERLRVTRPRLSISYATNCHAEVSDLIAPGNHSISGSITLPCSSNAFEILNVARVVAAERKTDDSARCCPGQVLCITRRLISPVPPRERSMPSPESKRQFDRISRRAFNFVGPQETFWAEFERVGEHLGVVEHSPGSESVRKRHRH
jgi:hypothetical protein